MASILSIQFIVSSEETAIDIIWKNMYGINIRWFCDDLNNPDLSYNIYRSNSKDGHFSLIATINPPFKEKNVYCDEVSSRYYYIVSACNKFGENRIDNPIIY